jgi:hypothetical protein
MASTRLQRRQLIERQILAVIRRLRPAGAALKYARRIEALEHQVKTLRAQLEAPVVAVVPPAVRTAYGRRR